MTESSKLPAEARAKRFRELAQDARREAARITDPGAKGAYLIMAEQWEALAASIDAQLRKGVE